ncbi:HAD hydrolase-like protein [Longispora urticae]
MSLLLLNLETLATGGAIGDRAAMIAVENVTGQTPKCVPPRSGRTDTAIGIDLLMGVGRTGEEARALLPAYCTALRAASHHLMDHYTAPARVQPGVHALLDRIDEDDIAAGLITADLKDIAIGKACGVGLYHVADWELGAYGEDAETFTDLIALAIRRAQGIRHEVITPQSTVVVGDTPAAIAAAQEAGALGVAVTTGAFTWHEFATADLILTDLSGDEALDALLDLTLRSS